MSTPLTTIDSVAKLRTHLQTALEIELTTIPPYLCALYSIRDGTNREAARVIQSVVMEEMLHMVLVANVLNAVGGDPSLDASAAPSYPGPLPHSAGQPVVQLATFSVAAIERFMAIEHPVPVTAPPEPDRYHSIAQFYAAVMGAMTTLEQGAQRDGGTIFTGPVERQIRPTDYYGGGGGIVVVAPPGAPGRPTALALAQEALAEVMHQGEGFPGESIDDGDGEPAHYYRFREIAAGRYYRESDGPGDPPSGPVLPVDWSAVWDMSPNPKAAHYADSPEVYGQMVAFNRAYTALLRLLTRAFNGERECMRNAAPAMYDLRYRAEALMKIPTGDGTTTVGPSFELWLD